jgi:hypothetical protein
MVQAATPLVHTEVRGRLTDKLTWLHISPAVLVMQTADATLSGLIAMVTAMNILSANNQTESYT